MTTMMPMPDPNCPEAVKAKELYKAHQKIYVTHNRFPAKPMTSYWRKKLRPVWNAIEDHDKETDWYYGVLEDPLGSTYGIGWRYVASPTTSVLILDENQTETAGDES